MGAHNDRMLLNFSQSFSISSAHAREICHISFLSTESRKNLCIILVQIRSIFLEKIFRSMHTVLFNEVSRLWLLYFRSQPANLYAVKIGEIVAQACPFTTHFETRSRRVQVAIPSTLSPKRSAPHVFVDYSNSRIEYVSFVYVFSSSRFLFGLSTYRF